MLQACDACADMGMTYSVIVQCADCVVFPSRLSVQESTSCSHGASVLEGKKGLDRLGSFLLPLHIEFSSDRGSFLLTPSVPTNYIKGTTADSAYIVRGISSCKDNTFAGTNHEVSMFSYLTERQVYNWSRVSATCQWCLTVSYTHLTLPTKRIV